MSTNEEYLESIGVKTASDAWKDCVEAMDAWGNNRWWLSDDPRERGYHQAVEEVLLLMSFKQYHEDIEILLSRPVFTHEFASPKLREEAERAWKYGVGCTSNEERRERQQDAVESLQRIAQEHGKDFIVVTTEEPENAP